MHRHAALVEGEQDRFRFDAAHADAQQVRQRSVAESLDSFDFVDDRARPIDECPLRDRLSGEIDGGATRRRNRSTRARSRCRPGAPAPVRPLPAAAECAARAGRGVPRPRGGHRTCRAVTEQRSAPSAARSTATYPAAAAQRRRERAGCVHVRSTRRTPLPPARASRPRGSRVQLTSVVSSRPPRRRPPRRTVRADRRPRP